MDSDRSAIATSIATAQAPSMGGNWLVLPVISVARMSPVTGAYTDAVKNAAIPMRAQAARLGTACGVRCMAISPTIKPDCVARTSIGANQPPRVDGVQ